jgi:YVTN family beta-propeller protein
MILIFAAIGERMKLKCATLTKLSLSLTKLSFSLITLSILVLGCAQNQDVFQNIGTNVASPSFISLDTTNNRMYLVNSNSAVLYDWTQGSFQVLDITNPLAPVLLNTLETDSFSGQVFIDGARALMTNRYSATDADKVSRLYDINIDEANADYLADSTTPLGENAYTMACCYPDTVGSRVSWITNSDVTLQYLDIDGDLSLVEDVNVRMTMDTGGTIDNIDASHFVILGAQGFMNRQYGGILVISLDKALAGDAVPVDYFINDCPVPRGMATDGSDIFVVCEGDLNGEWRGYFAIINPDALVPLTGNTTTQKVDEDDPDVIVSKTEVGQRPQQILLTTDYIFVTNKDDDDVSVIRKGTLERLSDIPVGDEPYTLSLYTDGAGDEKYVYVGNIASNTLSIIDIASLSVVATYP